jgi:copper chaperone CopZ
MYELQIEGMTCNHCISKVTRSLKQVDPAAKINVDLAAHRVRVESHADLEEITDALAEAGYPATNSIAY